MKRIRRALETLTACCVGILLAILLVRRYSFVHEAWADKFSRSFAGSSSTDGSPFGQKSNAIEQSASVPDPHRVSHQTLPTNDVSAHCETIPPANFWGLALTSEDRAPEDAEKLAGEPLPSPANFGQAGSVLRPTQVPAVEQAQETVLLVSWSTSPIENESTLSQDASSVTHALLTSEQLGASTPGSEMRRAVGIEEPQSDFKIVLSEHASSGAATGVAPNLELIAPPPPTLEPGDSHAASTLPPGHSENMQVELRDADIRDAIHTLSKEAGVNVLLTNSVQGKLSLSLNRLGAKDALFAVIKASGYTWLEESGVLYVGTSQEIKILEQLCDKISTRIYRPNYVSAKELESLIKPLVTSEIGLVTVSSAAEKGIAPNPADAGGDGYAGSDVVIVRDYERVLQEIDKIVEEVDIRPRQVAIEAMILSVNLDDKDQFGISFELLRNKGYVKFGWGFLPETLSDIKFDNSGLKFAYLDASLGAFLNALESIGDTNVIATPRLLVLNKHRAEILIGKELGYVSTTITETSASQTIDFLKVGAQLVIRPFISNDGFIRMEVHPEVSTGAVQITNNFTVPNKDTTQVTTNILVPDGATVIIGGLMREDLHTTSSQVPFLGNLPIIGAAFRNRMETTAKQEIIVLITPRIVDDYGMSVEGASASELWRRRQRVVADNMMPIGNHAASRRWLEEAKVACQMGNYEKAQRLAELAVRFDPNNVEAIALRDQLMGIKAAER